MGAFAAVVGVVKPYSVGRTNNSENIETMSGICRDNDPQKNPCNLLIRLIRDSDKDINPINPTNPNSDNI
jgi:hypothetical protein